MAEGYKTYTPASVGVFFVVNYKYHKNRPWLNRFFIGVNEYDSYEMLTFASWKTKVC